MNYSDFLSQVRCLMERRMGKDTSVSIHSVLKNNNLCLDGLLILHPGENITPTIYLNSYYEDYLDGASMEDIVSDIEQVYETNRCPAAFDVNSFRSFTNIRGRIAFRLINRAVNKKFLEDVPYLPFLDLAIVFFFTIENDYIGLSTALIHNRHMEAWETTTEELYTLAYENTRLRFGYRFLSMEQAIQNLSEKEVSLPAESGGLLHILTNREQIFGSSCILYDDILKEFSEKIGDDFYILPSSVHEVILVPRKKSPKAPALVRMVREINYSEVPPDEILSDTVYLYERSIGTLRSVVLPPESL